MMKENNNELGLFTCISLLRFLLLLRLFDLEKCLASILTFTYHNVRGGYTKWSKRGCLYGSM
ncbi:hypothetical protein [Pseudoalteromonas sp. DY56-GL79]|uniref:hypothetical protein n=1 Tax=Pseudoalteromonas sp. DY56-GL79 TaxID=2967131 RepID=UPI00352B4A3A